MEYITIGEWTVEIHLKVMTFILFPVLHDFAEVEINSAFKQRKNKKGTCQCQFCLISSFWLPHCCSVIKTANGVLWIGRLSWENIDDGRTLGEFNYLVDSTYLFTTHICDENLPSFAVSTLVSSVQRALLQCGTLYILPCHVEPKRRW